MAFTQDEIETVRILIPDAEAIYGDNGDEYLFSNDDIQKLLTVGKGNAMWAAGLAMIAVGNSEAMIGKVIRNYETETDASKLQREWRAAGNVMITNGRAEVAEDDGGFFISVKPDFEAIRHPEGMAHGGYRNVMPTGFQW